MTTKMITIQSILQDANAKVAPYIAKAKSVVHKGYAKYENWRGRAVSELQKRMPQHTAVIDRIAKGAFPDSLVYLGLATPILAFPALLYACGRVVVKIAPEVKKFARVCLEKDMDDATIKEFKKAVGRQTNDLFEKVVVPSVVVGCIFDAVFSIGTGVLTLSAGRMLRGVVLDIPAAILAWRYLAKGEQTVSVPRPEVTGRERPQEPARVIPPQESVKSPLPETVTPPSSVRDAAPSSK